MEVSIKRSSQDNFVEISQQIRKNHQNSRLTGLPQSNCCCLLHEAMSPNEPVSHGKKTHVASCCCGWLSSGFPSGVSSSLIPRWASNCLERSWFLDHQCFCSDFVNLWDWEGMETNNPGVGFSKSPEETTNKSNSNGEISPRRNSRACRMPSKPNPTSRIIIVSLNISSQIHQGPSKINQNSIDLEVLLVLIHRWATKGSSYCRSAWLKRPRKLPFTV